MIAQHNKASKTSAKKKSREFIQTSLTRCSASSSRSVMTGTDELFSISFLRVKLDGKNRRMKLYEVVIGKVSFQVWFSSEQRLVNGCSEETRI